MIPIRDDNPTRITPYFTIALIVINCLVFIYEFAQGTQGFREFTFKYGLIPAELMQGRDLTPPEYSHLASSPYLNLFTSMFMHGGIIHLGGNMLYLWIFGNNIEDVLGHFKFILFYILSGLAATLAFAFVNPNSEIPLVGASGAIAGILGAYMVRFPHARVYTLVWIFIFIRVVALPAVFLLGFWFLLQVINSSSTLSGGVAWFAHIGGFVFGAGVFWIFGLRYRRRRWYEET
ncbi:MAG: rhomboid family intramembrane serine protease [candidate division Zixibacteria bacterium]|nr:rhomboid family intramembrane serine protease [candidate division Zixibacteria bacterium]NIR63241.1 rhomboid family intramembrane serine protease [candidate division Zixibacteria bacterium]NIS17101.1 rhomboid family intramembrane serine protease [candidate division Zixibacteria bacterium]NIS45222.1 rhomboid family intramembrane serine protease [candidate division Zixibacteria bacterium]NIT53453.1 rhomboid family intramembrane serine protease [candidate division Zixibacteria bacterium]